jgi:hypothetical protein
MIAVFGGPSLGDSRTPWWTRIELDDGDHRQWAASFLRSLDRARAITAAMFARSSRITAVLSWVKASGSGFDPPFDQLRFMGFDLPDEAPDVVERHEEDGEVWWINRHYVVLDNDPDLLAPLMVAAHGGHLHDRLINLVVDLVDFDLGMGLEFYNHKGMTLISTRAETLAPIYQRYRDWVRDMELARCDEIFAPFLAEGRPGLSLVTPD